MYGNMQFLVILGLPGSPISRIFDYKKNKMSTDRENGRGNERATHECKEDHGI
jgi:hypothetical protein